MNCNNWKENWRKTYENGEMLPEPWERRISKKYSELLKQAIFYYKNIITDDRKWEEPEFVTKESYSVSTNSEIEPTIETKIEPIIEPKIEPKIETKIEPIIETKIEPKIETMHESITRKDIRIVVSDLNNLLEETNITQVKNDELESLINVLINSLENFIFGLMSTKLFIFILEKIGIEYKENKWVPNDKVVCNLGILHLLNYLNFFKYKSRIHDLLDILDNSIAKNLLEHLSIDTEGKKNIVEHIKNERKKDSKKLEVDFIEYWDVRKFKFANLFTEFPSLKLNKLINLQYWDTSNFTSVKNMFSVKDSKTQSIISMFDVNDYMSDSVKDSVNDSVKDSLNDSVSDSFETVVSGLKYWNTSRVTNMSSMFKNNNLFNEKLEWDTSQVVDMSSMFENATSFNQSVENWDVTKVINMKSMFKNAINFEQSIPWETKVIFDDNIITGSKAELTFEYYTSESNKE